MTQPLRLADGGRIDRDKPLSFSFNGHRYRGFAGDTLASALLANGVHFVGRSFKYHRPRGIMTAGPEEPNALVQVGEKAESEPNIRATELPLREGLVARSQNCWPTVEYDVGQVNDLLSPLFPAGFYYKTFMWPVSLWPTYERHIRKIAGMGVSSYERDPDHYDHHYGFCDVLVVGGGPAGLAAALAAGAGLDAVKAGLETLSQVAGRFNVHSLPGDITLIDDTYNANPESLQVALDVLAQAQGDSWLVLGDMGELGADAAALHGAAGRQARKAGVSRLYGLGELAQVAVNAFEGPGGAYTTMDELLVALQQEMNGPLHILVKGSRRMRMERVVAALGVKPKAGEMH